MGSTVHAYMGKGKRDRHEVKVVAINSDRTIGVRRVRARGWLFWGAWFLGGRAGLSLSWRSLRAAAFVIAARSLPIPLAAHTPPQSSARSGVI